MSVFDPVTLSKPMDQAVSATFLRAFNSCPRAGYLYQENKGGPSEPNMERGSAIHEAIARSLVLAVETDNDSVPGELVKTIGDEVLADPAFHVPIEEHDYVRESLWRWASWMTFNPLNVIAVESMVFLDIGGWRIRMRLDYAEMLDHTLLIRDWKSSRAAPSYEDIGRRRADGKVAAKQIQLILYALGGVFGRPVNVTVEADGTKTETIASEHPIMGSAQNVDLELVFPGIEDRQTDGPLIRAVSLSRLELEEYRVSIEGLLHRLDHAVGTGDWPAVQGDGHCGECPMPKACPIPEAARKYAPTVDTEDEARLEAQAIQRDAAELTARRTRLRNYVKRLPGERLLFGGDMVIEPVLESRTEIRDRDGFIEAAKAAAFGEPFDPSEWVKTSVSTPIRPRRLTAAELEEGVT